MQLLMNVFDSNIITQVHYAVAFASTTWFVGSDDGIGGLLDTVLWNNFASSDGNSGAVAVFRTDAYQGETDIDPSPFFIEVNNVWELFDDGTGYIARIAE